MSSAFRVAAGGLFLAAPAIALAGALVGDHPRRLARSLQLGVIAALPGVAALAWLQGHQPETMLGRITTVLAGLVPGYLAAGWLALRSRVDDGGAELDAATSGNPEFASAEGAADDEVRRGERSAAGEARAQRLAAHRAD